MISVLILIGSILGLLLAIAYESSIWKEMRTIDEAHEETVEIATADRGRSFNQVIGPWGWFAPTGNSRTSLLSQDLTPFPAILPNQVRPRIVHPVGTEPPVLRLTGGVEWNAGTLVRNWRKSIIGLTATAERNLETARGCMGRSDYKTAIQLACTSVENIARALLHSYGEKPDTEAGQVEALRLLSRRLIGDEKTQFENALDAIKAIDYAKTGSIYPLIDRLRISPEEKEKANRAIETASNTIVLFRNIMIEHFATEIPELRDEMCPKCHSLSVSNWSFSTERVSYGCNICHYTWVDPGA